MSFDPTTASDVRVARRDAELYVSWAAGVPGPYQVYVDSALAWVGTATSATLPFPTSSRVTIDVGSVGPAEASTDFSADLDPIADRVRLSWTGGDYLDPGGSVDHFAVRADAGDGFGSGGFGSSGYGGPGDDAAPTATVAAYPAGIGQGGYGRGGYGAGGFGSAAGSYSWTSDVLGPGSWNFAVSAVDAAGNEGVRSVVDLGVDVPPRAPAADADGVRLTYTYNPTTHVATLHWLASTGAIPSIRYHVYSNDGLGGPVDYGTPIGTTASLSFATPALATPSDNTFAVRVFDAFLGVDELNVDARVRVVVSASGADLSNLPAPPSSPSAYATAGGGAVVRWAWTPSGTGAPPTSFKVWLTVGGSVNYAASPAATVPFAGGRVGFAANLSGLSDAVACSVGVRATNAAGDETNTTVVASVTGSSVGPSAVDDLIGVAT